MRRDTDETPMLHTRYARNTSTAMPPPMGTALTVFGYGFQSLNRICSLSGSAAPGANEMSSGVGTNSAPPPEPPPPALDVEEDDDGPLALDLDAGPSPLPPEPPAPADDPESLPPQP